LPPLIGGFCTLIGGIAALVVFLPRPIVFPPSAPVDPNNVMSASFDISNAGYIPLDDVSIRIESKFKPNGAPIFDVRVVYSAWDHHYLGLDDRITINPENRLGGNIIKADIAVSVSYLPWIIPIRRERMFRFIAMDDGTGRTYWRSWPLDEPAPKPK
jgi:hypothetical protein